MSKFDAQFAGRLDGQTVLVTGTTKGGIGHETAQGAGNSGATVLVHARHADHARRAVDLLVSNGNGKGQYLAVAEAWARLPASASWSRRCTKRARRV